MNAPPLPPEKLAELVRLDAEVRRWRQEKVVDGAIPAAVHKRVAMRHDGWMYAFDSEGGLWAKPPDGEAVQVSLRRAYLGAGV